MYGRNKLIFGIESGNSIDPTDPVGLVDLLRTTCLVPLVVDPMDCICLEVVIDAANADILIS